ncbi:MAG: iron ABC transporter permease [Coriobacteriales bacterium]|nr:iron ABC transporter permease [Coriobacteriales bacterium]MBQ6585752.1 iron ABC transporter permease [Coriobacteriales bacterium]
MASGTGKDHTDNGHRVRPMLVYGPLAVALLLACIAALMLGSSSVGSADLFALITGGELPRSARNILLTVRIPRVIAAILSGCALATAGAIIQAVLNNPLASPNIIGVNAGAGLAVLLMSSLFPAAVFLLPAAAFAGALIAALLVFLISARTGAKQLTVILAGMALTAIFGAGMNTILIVDPDAYIGASVFLVGGLSGVRMELLLAPAVCIAMGIVLACFLARHLNVLSLGDQVAHSLGMDVFRVRVLALAVAALLAGSAVSFAGLLGFVGLVIPHLVRFIIGHDNKRVLPASALSGALFVVLCDLLARALFAPYELPVGILMAFLGGPFFIYLIVRRRNTDV